jgi:hypothetical protein
MGVNSHETPLQKRHRGAVIAVMIALPVGLVVTAGPASAASCSGVYCDGQDAVAAGCVGDAVTVARAAINNSSGGVIGRVDLRWSGSRGTNWTRTVSYIGGQELVAMAFRTADNYAPTETLIGSLAIW